LTLSGVINVNKPAGPTSFDVVARVRPLVGERRVGHAGTLDPTATGVLLLLIGKATRIQEYLLDMPKTYRVCICLGAVMDTYDASGRIVARSNPANITEAAVRSAAETFVGEIQQVPPPFSAIKIAGKRAYKLARAGETVALAPRPVNIHRIDIRDYTSPLLSLEVECGKGTYLRSLAHDLGAKLGCGGYVDSLERLRIGPFAIEDALTLAELAAKNGPEIQQMASRSLSLALDHLPSVTLDASSCRLILTGRSFSGALPPFSGLLGAAEGQRCQILDTDGHVVAIMRLNASEGAWKPEKILADANIIPINLENSRPN